MRRADGRILRVREKRVDIPAVIGDLGNIVNAAVVGVIAECEKEKYPHIAGTILCIARRKRTIVIVRGAEIERRIFKFIQIADVVLFVAFVHGVCRTSEKTDCHKHCDEKGKHAHNFIRAFSHCDLP